jgi:carbamoyltransferase
VWEQFVDSECGRGSRAKGEFNQREKNLAFKVQLETETAVLRLAQRLKKETGAKSLCLAGGVALNSVSNGLLQASGMFENVFVQPAAADNGQAIGLAYYGHLMSSPIPIKPMKHAFGGRSYSNADIKGLLDRCGVACRDVGEDEELAAEAARDLAGSKIVGWFQGGSELGPRALGHRSILADPRGAEMKETLNARVKFREAFRPFAPSVLAERADEIFDLHGKESPYMLIVAPVRPRWAHVLPAVTHIDGTGRVQTVDRAVDPLYHALVSRFGELTGVPVVLNTSFNIRGMPIVETPLDALQCFLGTGLDVLYLGRYRVEQPRPFELFPEILPGCELSAESGESRESRQRQMGLPRREGEDARALIVEPIAGVDLDVLCRMLDGKRSLAAALEPSLTDARGGDRTLMEATSFVKNLMRHGYVRLHFGSFTI